MLMKQGDASKEACVYRLKLGRIAAGLSKTEIAKESGHTLQTYAHQENGRVYPSKEVMRTLHRSYGIDYNFIFEGDFNHLPAQVQSRLFQAAASEDIQQDRTQH